MGSQAFKTFGNGDQMQAFKAALNPITPRAFTPGQYSAEQLANPYPTLGQVQSDSTTGAGQWDTDPFGGKAPWGGDDSFNQYGKAGGWQGTSSGNQSWMGTSDKKLSDDLQGRWDSVSPVLTGRGDTKAMDALFGVSGAGDQLDSIFKGMSDKKIAQAIMSDDFGTSTNQDTLGGFMNSYEMNQGALDEYRKKNPLAAQETANWGEQDPESGTWSGRSIDDGDGGRDYIGGSYIDDGDGGREWRPSGGTPIDPLAGIYGHLTDKKKFDVNKAGNTAHIREGRRRAQEASAFRAALRNSSSSRDQRVANAAAAKQAWLDKVTKADKS